MTGRDVTDVKTSWRTSCRCESSSTSSGSRSLTGHDLGWSEAIAALFSVGGDTSPRRRGVDAFRTRPGDGTGSAPLARTRARDAAARRSQLEAMTEDELVATYLLILFGGSETTTNLLGNGFPCCSRIATSGADSVRSRPSSEARRRLMLTRRTTCRAWPRPTRSPAAHHEGETVIVMMARPAMTDVFDSPTGRHHAASTIRPPVARLRPALLPRCCLGRLEGDVVFSAWSPVSPRACSPMTTSAAAPCCARSRTCRPTWA
jgi:hypothetical protein